MTDKIVYIHPDFESETTTITTPKQFDELLEDGWRIKERTRQKVEGKMMDVVHLTKIEKNRNAVAIRREQPQSHEVIQHGPPSSRHAVSIGKNNSFLGESDFVGLPGLQVGTSMMIEHAYALGVDAARAGKPDSMCPWEKGTIAATQWYKGWNAGAKVSGSSHEAGGETHDAYTLGKIAARGDEDLEVHCPYPPGTPHYDDWLRGFREGGGRVQ